ncbi:MAG: hypothetical protein AMJ61_02245 [Desulfobacterales bacterium SG8_35_2]|nr:MAG: hypothetical protein AMJ61_02245 [Desulfobacterales bacterium SG8_35_2]
MHKGEPASNFIYKILCFSSKKYKNCCFHDHQDHFSGESDGDLIFDHSIPFVIPVGMTNLI